MSVAVKSFDQTSFLKNITIFKLCIILNNLFHVTYDNYPCILRTTSYTLLQLIYRVWWFHSLPGGEYCWERVRDLEQMGRRGVMKLWIVNIVFIFNFIFLVMVIYWDWRLIFYIYLTVCLLASVYRFFHVILKTVRVYTIVIGIDYDHSTIN